MNKKFNMVLTVSIIFLISLGSVCDDDSFGDYPSTECEWGEKSYTFSSQMKFSHPTNPPFVFTQAYQWNPIMGITPILYNNGYVDITVISGGGCTGITSKKKEYRDGEGLNDTQISFVPDPTNASSIGDIKIQVYSQKFYIFSTGKYIRYLWTKSIGTDGTQNGNFTSVTYVTLDEDQYKVKPIYKDGGLQDPV